MDYYLLQTRTITSGLNVEINGVPLASLPAAPRESTRMQQINPWVVPGSNEVRVRIDWPTDEPFRFGLARAYMKVVRGREGAEIDGLPPLVVLDWPLDAPNKREGYPFGTQMRFIANPAPDSEFWPLAETIMLSPDERNTLIALLNQLESSLAKRDVDGAMSLLAFRTADLGRSIGMDSDAAQKKQRDMIAGLLALPDTEFIVHPIEQIRLHLVANGKLVWATVENQQPLIQFRRGQALRSFLPLYLGRLNGQWKIVR